MIYQQNQKPTPQCHASTIAQTPSGMIAAWFGGSYEGHPDVSIWIARHNGKTWLEPFEIANGLQSSGQRYSCWNPVLFYTQEGLLMLFYKVGSTPSSWWGMLMSSSDDGKTWSEPQPLGYSDQIGYLLGPVKNKPIQLEDGTIMCPSSTEIDGLWRVHFELTRDLGQTWEVIGPIHDGKDFCAIQPSILTYPDGKMQILCRTRQGVIAQSWSEDGRNWSQMQATSLPNPNSGTDAVTLQDGRQMLVYNHTKQGRSPLNLAISDDGYQWKEVMVLEDQEGEFSYPAIIQSEDGKVHLTYTYQRETIKHLVFDLDQLDNDRSL